MGVAMLSVAPAENATESGIFGRRWKSNKLADLAPVIYTSSACADAAPLIAMTASAASGSISNFEFMKQKRLPRI